MQPLCIVVKGFPRLSETFITRELEALQDAGLKFSLASLRRPQKEAGQVAHRVASEVIGLPEYLHDQPVRVIAAAMSARRLAGFGRAYAMARADLKRDFGRNRIRRFGQACVLAMEMPQETRHLHAHFIHTPASVARYAAAMRNISFSVSAHAKDIWTTPDWDLSEKLREAEFVCTCNEAGAGRLTELVPHRPPVLWPHLAIKVPAGNKTPGAEGPFRLLTVARAVPKKGLMVLLEALGRLPSAPAWTWTHIGGGPELETLKAKAMAHPYRERLNFRGARSHNEVLASLSDHDIFVLTAQVADDGDRDGRPNAVIEAMSAGLACVVTNVGGLQEAVGAGAGLVVPGNAPGIADALAGLLSSPETIPQLGDAARDRAMELTDQGQIAFTALERALRKASGQ